MLVIESIECLHFTFGWCVYISIRIHLSVGHFNADWSKVILDDIVGAKMAERAIYIHSRETSQALIVL